MEIDHYLQDGCESPRDVESHPLAELISRVSNRDHEAFTLLVMQTEPCIRRFFGRSGLSRSEQDDALQETFLAMYRYAHTYQPSRRPLPWVISIAINASRAHFRRQNRFTRILDSLNLIPLQRANPEGEASARSTLSFLENKAMMLPLIQRQVLGLATTSSLSLAEIGEALGIPENTAKSHLSRARRALAEALKNRDRGGVS